MTTASDTATVVDLSARRQRRARIEFEAVISTWDEDIRCGLTTAAGRQCSRAAQWRVDAHGCEQHLMCTGHLKNWLARVEAVLRIDGRTQCTLCGRWFTSLDTVQSAVRL